MSGYLYLKKPRYMCNTYFLKGVNKLRKSSITFVLAACLFGLSGCNATDNKNNINVNKVRNQGGTILNDTNQRLRVSTRAAQNVARLNEVDQAHVIIRNNDAYVAVRLKNAVNNRTGPNPGITGTTGTTGITGTTGTTRATGYNENNMGTTGYSGTTGTTGMTGTASTGRFGTNAGTINYGRTGADIGNTGITGNRNQVMYGNGYNSGGTGTPGTIGTTGAGGPNGTTGITGVPGTTGTNPDNTRLGTTDYSRVSSPLEQKIADRVRAADPSIHRVYVSVDPNFYTRMNAYYNDITNGRNRDGLINDFGNTVRRFFR